MRKLRDREIMAEILSLPNFVAFKATHGTAPFKYLGVVDDNSQYQNYVGYYTDSVFSDKVKFSIEFVRCYRWGCPH